jgi:hypothetical protein
MTQVGYARWLRGLPLTGWPALFVGVLAVVVPTMVRAAVNGLVMGCEYTPYLPFVLLSAILLKPWQATGVVLASVAIMGGRLMGSTSDHLTSACFTSATGVFLAASAVTIGAVILTRRAIAPARTRNGDEATGGIVFSLEDNEVWASWYGSDQPVRLGTQDKVEYMMADFLAQGELGRRLAAKRD